jgi:hypothetical protein
MMISDYAAGIASRQRHETYVSESAAYRMMRDARQSQRDARQSQRDARQLPVDREYRLVERIGARLITIGRALCERRGTVAVEVAFHAGPGERHQRPNGQHVA